MTHSRSQEIAERCSQGATTHYLTTENPDKIKESAQIFLHENINVENITLG